MNKNIIIIAIIIFCLIIGIPYFNIEKEKVTSNHIISKASNNILSYNGKLNYIRQNYSALPINNKQIIVIGQSNVSNIAEIYDLEKGKTISEIPLLNNYTNSFMLKLSDNKIMIIGNKIEIVDIQNNTTEEIYLPDMFPNMHGYAFKINEDEVYILRTIDNIEGRGFRQAYIYNIKTGEIKETEVSENSESLSFSIYKNPFININDNIYSASCNYIIEEYTTPDNHKGIKSIPYNCELKKFSFDEKKFYTVKNLEDKIPYNMSDGGNNNLIILYIDMIINYDIASGEYEIINFKNLDTQYVINLGDNKILLVGKDIQGKASYIIDLNKKTVEEYNFIDFKFFPAEQTYGTGHSILVNGKTYLIGLFGGKQVYEVK